MLSRRGKIILIVVAVILVVAIIVLYALSRNQPSPTQNVSPTPTDLGEFSQVPPAELPTGQAGGGGGASAPAFDNNGLPISQISATPTPRAGTGITATPTSGSTQNVGDLDFTKSQKNLKTITIDQQTRDRINSNPDICALSGIQNNWSNPFEKTVCGIEQFFNKQIIESLSEMICSFMGSANALNFSSNIKSSYINGRCYLIDR